MRTISADQLVMEILRARVVAAEGATVLLREARVIMQAPEQGEFIRGWAQGHGITIRRADEQAQRNYRVTLMDTVGTTTQVIRA